jgi:hypothetical protein
VHSGRATVYAPAVPDLIHRVSAVLRANGARWSTLATLDRDLLSRVPEPGEWSALECLNHAVETEAGVFAARLRVILAGGGKFPDFDPDAHATRVNEIADPAALAREHARQRGESLELLATVTEGDLDRTGIHGTLGEVTARELVSEWAGHDTMHVVQAERAIMQPFIEGSGPWRRFFWDHDVASKPSRPESA